MRIHSLSIYCTTLQVFSSSSGDVWWWWGTKRAFSGGHPYRACLQGGLEFVFCFFLESHLKDILTMMLVVIEWVGKSKLISAFRESLSSGWRWIHSVFKVQLFGRGHNWGDVRPPGGRCRVWGVFFITKASNISDTRIRDHRVVHDSLGPQDIGHSHTNQLLAGGQQQEPFWNEWNKEDEGYVRLESDTQASLAVWALVHDSLFSQAVCSIFFNL